MKNKIQNFIGAMCVKIYKPFSRGPVHRFMEERISDIKQRHGDQESKTVKVLNIGSGGDVYDVLSQCDCLEIVQLDIDPDRNPDIVSDVCDMYMIADESFDYVFAMEVLEHVATPQQAVDEIYRVLKSDGEFILSTPFIFPIHDAPHDYYRYTHYGLRHLLKQFEIKEIIERNDYIQSITLLLLRTIVMGNKKQRVVSAFLYFTTLLSYPFWLLLSKVFDSKLATTGYCGVVRKV